MLLFLLLSSWLAPYIPALGEPLVYLGAFALSVLEQDLIDAIGHTRKVSRSGVVYEARNRWHSLPGVVALGTIIGAPLAYVTGSWLLLALLIAPLVLHWLEDLVTESGIYLFSSGRRVRLPWRIPYNNVWANRLAVIALLAPVLALYDPLRSSLSVLLYSVALLYSITAIIST